MKNNKLMALGLLALSACNGSDSSLDATLSVDTPSPSVAAPAAQSPKPSAQQPAASSPSAFKTYTHFAYVATGNVDQRLIDPDTGELIEMSPKDVSGGNSPSNGTCNLRIHPNGKFLYAANCGTNTVAQFSIDATTGKLSPLAAGVNVTIPVTGVIGLSPLGNIGFNSDATFLYCTFYTGSAHTGPANGLYKFSVNPTTGALTLVPGTVITNPLPGHDDVSNWITTNHIDISQPQNAKVGNNTYKINQSTSMIDLYEGLSLGAFSHPVSSPAAIVIK